MRLLESALAVLVVIAALLRREPARRLPAGVDAEDLALGYEHSDANVGLIVASLVALLVALGLVLVFVTWFGVRVTGEPIVVERPQDLVNRLNPAPTPPPPRLEASSGADFAAYRAAALERLSSYGWVDRQSGTVSIPINQAMDEIAQRGLPARPPQTVTAQDNATSSPSSASSGRFEESILP
jgi:hypothetical protein